jgi:hypothetical protein
LTVRSWRQGSGAHKGPLAAVARQDAREWALLPVTERQDDNCRDWLQAAETERQRGREAEKQRDRETERQRGRERGQDTSMSVRSAREPRHFGPHEAHVELEAHTPMGGSSRLRALQSALGSATTSRWSAHACGSSPSSSSPSSSRSSSGASTGDGGIVALAPLVDGDPAQTAAIRRTLPRSPRPADRDAGFLADCPACLHGYRRRPPDLHYGGADKNGNRQVRVKDVARPRHMPSKGTQLARMMNDTDIPAGDIPGKTTHHPASSGDTAAT